MAWKRPRRAELRRRLRTEARANPDSRLTRLPSGDILVSSQQISPPKTFIRLVDESVFPPQVAATIREKRAVQRRSGANRRWAGDRRKPWFSNIEPILGKDGYYHIHYPNGAIGSTADRRKITNYTPINGNFLCYADRRSGSDRRLPGERRKPGRYKVEPAAHGKETMPTQMKGLAGVTIAADEKRKRVKRYAVEPD